jgi:hypothetical protein
MIQLAGMREHAGPAARFVTRRMRPPDGISAQYVLLFFGFLSRLQLLARAITRRRGIRCGREEPDGDECGLCLQRLLHNPAREI